MLSPFAAPSISSDVQHNMPFSPFGMVPELWLVLATRSLCFNLNLHSHLLPQPLLFVDTLALFRIVQRVQLLQLHFFFVQLYLLLPFISRSLVAYHVFPSSACPRFSFVPLYLAFPLLSVDGGM